MVSRVTKSSQIISRTVRSIHQSSIKSVKSGILFSRPPYFLHTPIPSKPPDPICFTFIQLSSNYLQHISPKQSINNTKQNESNLLRRQSSLHASLFSTFTTTKTIHTHITGSSQTQNHSRTCRTSCTTHPLLKSNHHRYHTSQSFQSIHSYEIEQH